MKDKGKVIEHSSAVKRERGQVTSSVDGASRMKPVISGGGSDKSKDVGKKK